MKKNQKLKIINPLVRKAKKNKHIRTQRRKKRKKMNNKDNM